MPGHYWHPLHGDMPLREMNDEPEPSAVEGEMPTRSMHDETQIPSGTLTTSPAENQALDAELATYLEEQGKTR